MVKPQPPKAVRARLLEGLETSIRERGYAATTVSHVVAAAGTSKRTFYEHFATKEECLLEHFRRFHAGIVEAVAEGAPDAATSAESTEISVGLYFRAFAGEPELAKAHLLEILTLGEPAIEARHEISLRYVAMMQSVMATPRDDRPAKHLSAERGLAIIGGINEIALAAIRKDGPDTDDAVAQAISFVMAAIGDLPEIAG